MRALRQSFPNQHLIVLEQVFKEDPLLRSPNETVVLLTLTSKDKPCRTLGLILADMEKWNFQVPSTL